MLALVLAWGAAWAQDAPPSATAPPDKSGGMTIERLFELAGARSAAARSGRFSARVTEYRCLAEGQAAIDAYTAYVQSLQTTLGGLGPEVQPAAAQVAPDRKTWAVDTWYELDYAYDGGRYRLSRVTPSGSTCEAFDGVAAYRVDQRTLYIERPQKPAEHTANLDISLMRWDLIPKKAYVRDDQKYEVIRMKDDRYNLWLQDKKSGATIDQVFNVDTGMLERATMHDAQEHVLQESQWLKPVMQGTWLPTVFIKMEHAGGHIQLEVRLYRNWEARPLDETELAVPADTYDSVATIAFPSWEAVTTQQREATRAAVQAVQQKFDEELLKQTPPESYVMRTLGILLIAAALILILVWAVRWRRGDVTRF